MQAPDDAVERALRSFAAAVLGLAAHELNNRLAVMRETLGLLDDLARAGRDAAAGTARAYASLDEQVGRALNVVRTVSGLGGALGSTGGGFDAGAAVGDLAALSERWARQKSLLLERDIAGGLPRAAGDPALFLCLLHRLLLRCAAGLGHGARLVISVGRLGEDIRVGLSPVGRQDAGPAPAAGDDAINFELARRLGGELTFDGGGAATIRLVAFR